MKILVAEDSPQDREIISDILAEQGHRTVLAGTLREARQRYLDDPDIQMIISDNRLPDGKGLTFLGDEAIRVPVIILTAFADVEEAVEAMNLGAWHYLTKPLRPEELKIIIQRVSDAVAERTELHCLRELHRQTTVLSDIVVRSPGMIEAMRVASAVATSEASVLLLGESGTGKEVLAQAIHRMSDRAQKPFVAVNCGAIPPTLLEDELFGHERGAFTGATARRIGKVERAQHGTLFLDEIGTMPAELQSRLLRVLQEKEIERIGGSTSIRVNFRLISATNADLAGAVANGTFREDLYYRIKVISILLPPLRERREEIPFLVKHFLRVHGCEKADVASEVMERLVRHAWPGNIRELGNAVEHAIILAGGGRIELSHLPIELRVEGDDRKVSEETPLGENDFLSLDELKRRHVLRALERSNGRREVAAEMLGIHRNTLRFLVRRFQIDEKR